MEAVKALQSIFNIRWNIYVIDFIRYGTKIFSHLTLFPLRSLNSSTDERPPLDYK